MSNLGNQASQCSLDKVAGALLPALKKSVLQSLNFSTFVWVIKNKDDANKIVKVLRENGFSNISLDSKGTTITAQSNSGSQNAGNDSSTECTGTRQGQCEIEDNESDCKNTWTYGKSCNNQCIWEGNIKCIPDTSSCCSSSS